MNEQRPTLKVYKFLPAKYAIRCIERKEIKVSTFDDSLNDPFDFSPHYLYSERHSVENNELFMEAWKETFKGKYGIISTSLAINDPVVWAHYADNHRGIVLEFEHWVDDSLIKIDYNADRPILDFSTFGPHNHTEILNTIMRSKWISWSYEEEYRVYVQLKECKTHDGFYFWPLPNDFLTGVILGFRCASNASYIEAALRQGNYKNVNITQAKPCEKTYRILV